MDYIIFKCSSDINLALDIRENVLIHLNPFLKSQGFAFSFGEQNYGGGESSTTEIYYLILYVGRDL